MKCDFKGERVFMSSKKIRALLDCRTVSHTNPDGNKKLTGRIIASLDRVGGIIPKIRGDLGLAGEYFDSVLGGVPGTIFRSPDPSLHDDYIESNSKEIRFGRWDIALLEHQMLKR